MLILQAFFGIWNRKSDIGLVGNTIDIRTGVSYHYKCLFPILTISQRWTYPETTGIGAGIDSFYEYALKWYILSGKF